jgi:hypothetical protein
MYDETTESFIEVTNKLSGLSKCINIENKSKEDILKIIRFYEAHYQYTAEFKSECVG